MLAHEEAAEHYARAIDVQGRFQPEASERRCELLLRLGEARVRGGERALGSSAFREAAALAERLGDGASLARAAIGASRRYVQPPGVVDTELIAMIERALELEPDRSLVRVRLLACLCGAIYYSPERDRMRALSDEAIVDRRRARGSGGARVRVLGAPPGAVGRAAPGRAGRGLDRDAHARAPDREPRAPAPGARVARRRPARARRPRRGRRPDGGVRRRRRPAPPAAVRVELDPVAGDAGAAGRVARRARTSSPRRRSPPARRRRRSPCRSTTRFRCSGSGASRGGWGSSSGPRGRLVEDNPGRPAWRAALATLLCEEGRFDEARDEF